MIGRFTHPENFRELFDVREVYLTIAGALLILVSFIMERVLPGQLLPDVIALCALVFLGGPIIWGAVTGILGRQLNVDELVSLAMIAAVLIGEYLSAAIVAFIMVLGSTLEKVTSQRARSAISALVRMNPESCVVLKDGVEKEVPLSEVQPGDLVLIKPGGRIPVDGVVERGAASVNQASLTGESLPVEKSVGDSVYAGTASYSGMIVIRVEKAGEDTTLGKLIRLVQDAEQMRAPVLRVADRFARYFTPMIIGIGAVVYFITGDIYRAITVLIVGCPCAFILAAPTAVTAALGNAARNGILIKSGVFLEELGRISALVLDKTGTLTTGRPVVNEIIMEGEYSKEELLYYAATAERYSEHPLASAILDAAGQKGLLPGEPSDFHQVPGRGIEAMVDGKRVFVGRAKKTVVTTKGAEKDGACLVVQVDGRTAGHLFIADDIRPGALSLVTELRRLGLQKVLLLSGDSEPATAYVAKVSGIEDYAAGLLPEEKLARIRELQQSGFKVAMVGDGVNDAPSLAAADIGVAMGVIGTDVAMESADVALMGDDLTKVPYVLERGQVTLRTINFNIGFAFIFNLLALVASGMGYLTPILGAIVHNVGSVLVVLNSARLIRGGPSKAATLIVLQDNNTRAEGGCDP